MNGNRGPALAAAVLLLGATIACPQTPQPDAVPAAPARLATNALLLDIARAENRLIAVGEHGIILQSDDDGLAWTQAAVPSRAMLTGVSFSGAEGWAVGHGGTVLRSTDAGATWVLMATPAGEEDSFLDVLALAPGHALAAGAYGLFLETKDGGATWETRQPVEEDMHINRISRSPHGSLHLAGEAGMLAASADNGASWRRLETPYEGSFYGLYELVSRRLIAHGLRGNVFASDDDGETWSEIPLDEDVLVMGALEPRLGVVILTGLGGKIFVSYNDAASFHTIETGPLKGTAEVIGASGGQALVLVGDGGVHRLTIPEGGG